MYVCILVFNFTKQYHTIDAILPFHVTICYKYNILSVYVFIWKWFLWFPVSFVFLCPSELSTCVERIPRRNVMLGWLRRLRFTLEAGGPNQGLQGELSVHMPRTGQHCGSGDHGEQRPPGSDLPPALKTQRGHSRPRRRGQHLATRPAERLAPHRVRSPPPPGQWGQGPHLPCSALFSFPHLYFTFSEPLAKKRQWKVKASVSLLAAVLLWVGKRTWTRNQIFFFFFLNHVPWATWTKEWPENQSSYSRISPAICFPETSAIVYLFELSHTQKEQTNKTTGCFCSRQMFITSHQLPSRSALCYPCEGQVLVTWSPWEYFRQD